MMSTPAILSPSLPAPSLPAPSAAELDAWIDEIDSLHSRIAPRFVRAEPRRRAQSYLKALLRPVERKNGWQVAAQAGEATPDGMQRLLNASSWDTEVVRDDLLNYVREQLMDPAAILVVEEIGFVKKGTKSAGVQRQSSGTTGQRANCQVGVFAAYSSLVPIPSQVLVDRELYLPETWQTDWPRRQQAGIPADVAAASKPELARRMLARVAAVGLPAAWVTGDTVYGGSDTLRCWLETQPQPYVLGITGTHTVNLPEGPDHPATQLPAAMVAHQEVTPRQWRRLAAGDGKGDGEEGSGPRLYDWALVRLVSPPRLGFEQALLLRRSIAAPTSTSAPEISYYLTFAPTGTLLETLVAVAGRRWSVAERLAVDTDIVGLAHYEVRHYHGWYRHVTLALLAMAARAAVRARLAGRTWATTAAI